MRFQPKKRLGQNFLVDKNIRRKIIEVCGFKPGDIILEIGSGRGEMTGLIAERVKKVFALEIDHSLTWAFQENIKDSSNISLINENILKFDLKKHFKNIKKIKVFGNIPYYISSPIIEHLFKYRGRISEIFITVQKEFAERMIAAPGSKDYGRLSCFVQYYAKPKNMFTIKKGSFFPVPKVDSCLLKLEIRKKTALKKGQEKLLFAIIKAAFGMRRKALRNSLKGVVKKEALELFFRKDNLEELIRPEDISLAQFSELAEITHKQISID